MKIECVVVSVDCADYLCHSLPLNKGLFDRTVVVTAGHDHETQRLCQHFNVECFVTEEFYAGGAVFNKGRAINAALEHLDFREWCVHQDADIVLPPLTRSILEGIPLSEQDLHGIDRVMCPSFDYWMRFVQNPVPQHEQAYIHVGPFPVGTRLYKREQQGWIPLGFFQMFHRESAYLGTPLYPTGYDSAASSDLHFAYRWPRTNRVLTPEIIGIHLATDDITNAAMGQNWLGRKTRRFGPRDPFTVGDQYRPRPAPG